jgi:Transcription elongation factor
VLKVVIDEESNRIETVVPQKDYSIAIGRKGQNARLASKLTGWSIDILTEEEEAKIRKEEAEKVFEIFVKHLKLDDMLARVLIAEGITEVEEILMISAEELATVEGFDIDKATDLLKNAEKFSKSKTYKNIKWERYSLDEALMDIKHMDANIALCLKRNNVRDVNNLADLSRDEFKDYVPENVLGDDKKIDELIMNARDIAFTSEAKEVKEG